MRTLFPISNCPSTGLKRKVDFKEIIIGREAQVFSSNAEVIYFQKATNDTYGKQISGDPDLDPDGVYNRIKVPLTAAQKMVDPTTGKDTAIYRDAQRNEVTENKGVAVEYPTGSITQYQFYANTNPSTFPTFDSLIDALCTQVAAKQDKKGKFNRLNALHEPTLEIKTEDPI